MQLDETVQKIRVSHGAEFVRDPILISGEISRRNCFGDDGRRGGNFEFSDFDAKQNNHHTPAICLRPSTMAGNNRPETKSSACPGGERKDPESRHCKPARIHY
jgi:hypothetical protein